MNQLQRIGKKNTILISISILLVSLYTIYFYNLLVPNAGTGKLSQQMIRFILTGGLLVFAYNGKNWARILSIVLFSIASFGAVFSLFSLSSPLPAKIPFLVMIIVYSASVYHFGFSKSFKAFSKYQNEKLSLNRKY